jgi:hypothetical protein
MRLPSREMQGFLLNLALFLFVLTVMADIILNMVR